MRGAGGVWSPRDPVKVENTGSNPVRRARSSEEFARVAEWSRRQPTKLDETGSIPVARTNCGRGLTVRLLLVTQAMRIQLPPVTPFCS